MNSTALSIFILLMIVGGCSFSMAGGIRISKLIAFAKSVKQAVKGVFIKEENGGEHGKGTEPNYFENFPVLVSILLLIFTLVIFAILFTTMGVSFTDAIFEVGSAITTNGISMGATTVTMPLAHKWLMIAAMTIGRVEILTVILALFPYKNEKE